MWWFAIRTIVHFRRVMFPLAAGMAAASAVIVGALIVGDSVRGSLRSIAMDRIGNVDRVLLAPRWFDSKLVANVTENLGRTGVHAEGVMFVTQVVAEHRPEFSDTPKKGNDTRSSSSPTNAVFRAQEMTLFGVEESFWSLGSISPKALPRGEEVVLNQSLATKLNAAIGDSVTLKVAREAVVPADSVLGKREAETIALPRWKVVDILPDVSLARFSLQSDQRPILNAFVSKSALQNAIDITDQCNAVFATESNVASTQSSPTGDNPTLMNALKPSLTDLGLSWQLVSRSFPNRDIGESSDKETETSAEVKSIFRYHQLTSDQMLFNDEFYASVVKETNKFPSVPVLTYLANGSAIVNNDSNEKPESERSRTVPYSTISAVSWETIAEMLRDSGVNADKTSAEQWVVINSWLADQMKAKIGDTIKIDYYLPETVEGKEIERSFDARVVAIAPLTEPTTKFRPRSPAKFSAPPTPFNDPAWTPSVPGITDQESISKWETPFPLTRKIETADDDYWNSHRLTPKLFISRELGVSHFGSRFGSVSSIRYDGLSEDSAREVESTIERCARMDLSRFGWREIPIRQNQLAASSGTTPFDALFLSLSFFVIVAALLLVALLFRFSVESRADHWGLFIASGWNRVQVRNMLLREGAIVACFGSAVGVLLGIGYAYAMLAGLRTWWIGAITVSFLDFHLKPLSLFIGWALGCVATIGTVYVSARQLKKLSVSRLLKGEMESSVQKNSESTKRFGRRVPWAIVCCVLGGITVASGTVLQGQAQAGAFVGGGMLFLVAGLLYMYRTMRLASTDSVSASSLSSLFGLTSTNAKRAPTRSILTIGLISIASFLILSMSLFQASPNEAGTGGFAFIGKSSQPIHKNLADPEYQRLVLGDKAKTLESVQIVNLRVRGGDDASCNNLYQSREPQVIGVSPKITSIDRNALERSAFAWFATDTSATNAGESESGRKESVSPWHALERAGDGTEMSPLPVVIDQNTALWALHLGGYVGERFSYEFDRKRVYFQTVGVLQNTILQGSLIIGEDNFERVFPTVNGYRMFLIKTPQSNSSSSQSSDAKGLSKDSLASESAIRMLLEDGWNDTGLSLASSDDVLAQLLAVQNTYLGAFQVLGALGLLLGTFGLGVTLLRSAMERRSELAAMRAMGFSKRRLIEMLILENGWQLVRGLGVGGVAAGLSTLPAVLSGQAGSGILWPLCMVAFVFITGIICCVVAAVLAMRWPLLDSLRSDR